MRNLTKAANNTKKDIIDGQNMYVLKKFMKNSSFVPDFLLTAPNFSTDLRANSNLNGSDCNYYLETCLLLLRMCRSC
jgi:hypothetical protein